MKNRFTSYDPAMAAGFVASWEGFVPEAYKCPAGVLTIGFGHTKGVKPGDSVTYEKAWTMLTQDLADFQRQAAPLVTALVTPNQFVALMSFIYNLGIGNFKSSTLLKKLNAGDEVGAAVEFRRWVNAGGVRLEGLVKRRSAEAVLFLKSDD